MTRVIHSFPPLKTFTLGVLLPKHSLSLHGLTCTCSSFDSWFFDFFKCSCKTMCKTIQFWCSLDGKPRELSAGCFKMLSCWIAQSKWRKLESDHILCLSHERNFEVSTSQFVFPFSSFSYSAGLLPVASHSILFLRDSRFVPVKHLAIWSAIVAEQVRRIPTNRRKTLSRKKIA